MNLPEHLLVIAMEECSELQKELSKALRFGPNDRDPKAPHATNREKIVQEFADLRAVMEMIHEAAIIEEPHNEQVLELILAKKLKVSEMLKYSREQGTLR